MSDGPRHMSPGELLVLWLHVLASELRVRRFAIGTELELQDGIEGMLRSYAQFRVAREYRIGPRDRIDFALESPFLAPLRIGIEVKTKGPLEAVTRQIHRYAMAPPLSAILLATTCSRHTRMPDTMNGKPVRAVHLLGSLLG